jgi:DNA-binding transcriptional LysR family regulator
MLELRRLALLRAVSAHGSLSAAAHAMSYTPSAASQQLRLLERELGLRLVMRGSRGATLTPAGLTLLEHAHAILGRTEAAQADMHALATLHAGRLRLAVFPTAGAAFMPEVIAAFTRLHPGVELSLTETETDESLLILQRHELDLVVGYGFEPRQITEPEDHRVALFDDPLRLALPGDHHLTALSRIPLADLSHEAWIDSNAQRPCSQALHAACAAVGFAPRIVYRSDDYATVHRLVAAGVGIALVPNLVADPHRLGVTYRDTAPALPIRRVYAVTTDAGTPAAAAMCKILSSTTAGRRRDRHDPADPTRNAALEVSERCQPRAPGAQLVGGRRDGRGPGGPARA